MQREVEQARMLQGLLEIRELDMVGVALVETLLGPVVVDSIMQAHRLQIQEVVVEAERVMEVVEKVVPLELLVSSSYDIMAHNVVLVEPYRH
jgi:hypothetical protein